MPLFARLRDHHYPDAERSSRLDYYIVLSGGLQVGGFHRIGSGPREGRWSWGAWIGSGIATFTASGYAAHAEVCRTLIALAFRRMLARADLREQPDAKPGPPRRAADESVAYPQSPPPDDCDSDGQLGSMLRVERRVAVRSGELTIGVLARTTHGEEAWTWTLTGVHRPDDDPDFVGHGVTDTEQEAFDALAACWSRWLNWAGLEQVQPFESGVKR